MKPYPQGSRMSRSSQSYGARRVEITIFGENIANRLRCYGESENIFHVVFKFQIWLLCEFSSHCAIMLPKLTFQELFVVLHV